MKISFETAKLAKEKGFRCLNKFGYITQFYHPISKKRLYYGRLGRIPEERLYYAPQQYELQEWLLNRGISVCPFFIYDAYYNSYFFTRFGCKIINIFNGDHIIIDDKLYRESGDNFYMQSYESALEAGLQEGLKLLK